MTKIQKTLVALLAVLGAFAVHTNTAESVENNLSSRQTWTSDAAVPVTAFEVSRATKRASRTAMLTRKFQVIRRQLSDRELKQLLALAGFHGKHLKEAWCIAKRETNGRPLAHNKNRHTGDNSYGIFQINMIGSLGPARRDKFNLGSNSELFNALKNAKIAHYMSNGGKDWSSWHGFNADARKWLKYYPA